VKSLKNTFHDQNYWLSLLWYLTKHLVNEDAESLLLGVDDQEIASTYSTYDWRHVQLKASHIEDTIQIMYENTETQTPTMWLGCCKQACATKSSVDVL
jgi:hypothetical protein